MKYNKQKLKALLITLSEAQQPNRNLDMALHDLCVGLQMYESFHERGGDFCIRYYPGPPNPDYLPLPYYTKSIDASLKLLPEGWTRAVDATAPEMGIAVDFFPPDKSNYPSHRWCVGDHNSEAIATCLAALKARIGAKK